MDPLDFLAKFDIISRIEGWVSTFLRADWQRARRHGVAGVAGELGRCLTRSNAPAIHFKRNAGWAGIQVERLLASYGVRIFDRSFDEETLRFRVAARQYEWADYLLRRAGVPVVTPPPSETNALVWQRYAPGTMPTPWSKRPRQTPDSPATDDDGDLVGRLFSLIDRLF